MSFQLNGSDDGVPTIPPEMTPPSLVLARIAPFTIALLRLVFVRSAPLSAPFVSTARLRFRPARFALPSFAALRLAPGPMR